MARKGSVQAETEIQRVHEARLRYLSRNFTFRKMIDSLIELRNALPGKPGDLTWERVQALQGFRAKVEEAAGEWGVPWVLLSQLSWDKWHESADHKERIPAAFIFSDSPVIAWTEILPPWVSSLLGDLPEPRPEDARYLTLRVDLDHPVETLLPLIERELGQYSRVYRKGRRRLDQVDFHLSVFDLAEAGQTFKAIASKLKRQPSTVKSAFAVARRNIFGDGGTAPSKKSLVLLDFDPDKHFGQCSTCRAAQTPEEFCIPAQRYAMQDHESQRDPMGLDTVARDIPQGSATAERVRRPDELLDS